MLCPLRLLQGLLLRASYMLQHQWREDPAAKPPQPSSQWGVPSTVGQRALSLSTGPGVWAVVPAAGQQRSSIVAAGLGRDGASAGEDVCHGVFVGGVCVCVRARVAHVHGWGSDAWWQQCWAATAPRQVGKWDNVCVCVCVCVCMCMAGGHKRGGSSAGPRLRLGRWGSGGVVYAWT